jgi:hypothetical protein
MYAVAALAAVSGALVVYAQTPPAKKEKPAKPAPAATPAKAETVADKDLSAFMRLKLDHSQKVLEGLVVEDFKLIAHHSNQMALLVQDENWMVLQTPEYRHYSADFQMIANRLTEAAREENLDGAALAYVDLTMSCVNCHKYTRGARVAARD